MKPFEVSLANKVFASPMQTLFALKVQNQLTSTADENGYHLTAAGRRGWALKKQLKSPCVAGTEKRALEGTEEEEEKVKVYSIRCL